MDIHTTFLIVGAGPFGIAQACLARDRRIDHIMVGTPMAFWRGHMPSGMYLRSDADWHLDPSGVYTIERFLGTQGLTREEAEPLALWQYLQYADWLQTQKGVQPLDDQVLALNRVGGARGRFRAEMGSGNAVTAEAVLLALGFGFFAHVPPDVVRRLPAGRWAHTCDFITLDRLRDQRCLIVGGRQSAFEWAALLNEAGAASVHVVHRHHSPRFAQSDWSWVQPLVARFEHDPGWYRTLLPADRDALEHKLWSEGRLKVEPWLEARCRAEGIIIWPRTEVLSSSEGPGAAVTVSFDNGQAVAIDQIILATGYKADLTRVPFLARGNLLAHVACDDGRPLLDDTLQTTVGGLYATSLLAVRDFGPFFGFTVAARTSARLVMRGLAAAGIRPGTEQTRTRLSD